MNQTPRRSMVRLALQSVLLLISLCSISANAAIPAKVTTNTESTLFNSPGEICSAITSYWAGVAASCKVSNIVGGCPGWENLSTSRIIEVWYPDSAGNRCPYTKSTYTQTWGTNCTAVNSTYVGNGQCQCNAGYKESPLGFCYVQFDPPKCNGPCGRVGNPVNPSTGTKYHEEVIYAGIPASPLKYRIAYNSKTVSADATPVWVGIHGALWTGGFESRVIPMAFITSGIPTQSATPSFASIVRPDGRQFGFTGISPFDYAPQGDVSDRLTRLATADNTTTGWRYDVADGSVENYDANGRLIDMTNSAGVHVTFAYSTLSTPIQIAPKPGLLISASDSFGRSLAFAYNAQGRIAEIADPSGARTLFSYDGPSSNGKSNNLTAITYADGATKTFYYNEPANTANAKLPNHLTGIVDENNVRFATYQYHSWGGVYKSMHAGGVDAHTFGYSYMAPTTVTDALGTSRIHAFQNILGVQLPIKLTQPCGTPNCSGTVESTTSYDANANIVSKTDFNGNKTTYTYTPGRNLEATRVEAAGTALARTISTQWHATLRLPLIVAEPLRITNYEYDSTGNLLTKTEQATADATGGTGVSAQKIGAARTWTYTYNQFGQMLTAKGPRTDVQSLVQYSYDAQGNIVSVTNAVGHQTTLSAHDANGRVGTMTDPNGLNTHYAYNARGWLSSVSVGGETTSLDYDAVGQLISVTQPGKSTIYYTYDAAHRLIAIADTAGNSINYTLDLIGNRTSELVKDPNGVLSRKTTRVFDMLNRLKQVTGAQQ